MSATIYNSDLTKELVDAARIQSSRDKVPNQIAEKVVPVMEVNPKLMRRTNYLRNGVLNNATSATIATTPTDRELFITNAMLGYIKDGTSTATLITLDLMLDGGTSNTAVISIPSLSTTAGSDSISVQFANPIKVAKGTLIRIQSDTNIANIRVTGTVQGYTVENYSA